MIPAGPEEGKRMETILIMAQALAKASRLEILRLDIQYNRINDEIIKRLPGFVQYTKDKKEGII